MLAAPSGSNAPLKVAMMTCRLRARAMQDAIPTRL